MSVLGYIAACAFNHRKAYYALGKLGHISRGYDIQEIKAARRRSAKAKRRR